MYPSLFILAFLLIASPSTGSHAAQARLTPGPLINDAGMPGGYGWSPQEFVRFNARALRSDRERLRKWDFFTVANERVAANFTIADIGFGRFCSVDLIDFTTGESVTAFAIPLLATDRQQLSETTRDATVCKMGGDTITFDTLPDRRIVRVDMPAGLISADVKGTLVFHQPAHHEYLSFVMPFDEVKDGFFYENKIPALPAEGTLESGGRSYAFSVTDSFAVMDWGRGVWPAEVTWHWAAAAGYVDGVPVGFNLGYGFGNTTAATENIVTVDGQAHKLGDVKWTFDRTDWMKPWRFESPDGQFDLRFKPVYPQQLDVNLLIKGARLDKLYGKYSGTIRLEDGNVIEVQDMFGFAEEMEIKW